MKSAESQRPTCKIEKGPRGPCGGPLTTLVDGDRWPEGANLRCAACGMWSHGTDDEVALAQRADRRIEQRLAAERREPLPPHERVRRSAARQRNAAARQAQGSLIGEEAPDGR